MTVELTVTATRTREAKAGFKVPIAEVELGGAEAGSAALGRRCQFSWRVAAGEW